MKTRSRIIGWVLMAAALIAGGWTSYQAYDNEQDSYARMTSSNNRQAANSREINDIQANEVNE